MKPLVRGQREFLTDSDGVQYIDALSGVYNASYGHSHPAIINALRTPEYSIINCYDNPTPERLALEEALQGLTDFSEAHLFSSGAETVEKALTLALRSAPSSSVLHFSEGFHGKTMGTYPLFVGHGSGHKWISAPLCARVVNSSFDEEVLLSDVRSALVHRLPANRSAGRGSLDSAGCGVVIIEPVMGYFGRVFSCEFLKRLRSLCTERGVILIFDEMITSFGRTGVSFVSNVVKPDILVVGKGLGQGLPIMAVLFDEDGPINAKDFSWTTATANNVPLCRVGLESCRVLVEERMSDKSMQVGEDLRRMLLEHHAIQRTCAVSGIGSMIFVEVKEEENVKWLEDQMRDAHHILTRAHADTLVLMPPFVTSISSLQKIVFALAECLSKKEGA